MNRTKYILLPRLTKILEELGEEIKLALLRRKLSAEQGGHLTLNTLAD